MKLKETKSYKLVFSEAEARMISDLIKEQVGTRTVESIMDDFTYCFHWFRGLFTLIPKVYDIGTPADLDWQEEQTLTSILSKAYNDGKHEQQKDMIKEICDAIDTMQNARRAI